MCSNWLYNANLRETLSAMRTSWLLLRGWAVDARAPEEWAALGDLAERLVGEAD